MTTVNDMRNLMKLLEDATSDLEGSLDGNGTDQQPAAGTQPDQTNQQDQKVDPKKLQLIAQFAKAMNPTNYIKVKDALVAIDGGNKPTPDKLHALLEVVVNLFKAVEEKPTLLQELKTVVAAVSKASIQQ